MCNRFFVTGSCQCNSRYLPRESQASEQARISDWRLFYRTHACLSEKPIAAEGGRECGRDVLPPAVLYSLSLPLLVAATCPRLLIYLRTLLRPWLVWLRRRLWRLALRLWRRPA